jgi:redox-sensing transcriptional repressor
MTDGSRLRAPEASLYRLSMYHCHLLDVMRSEPNARITSLDFARELGIKEETVRRDLSYVGAGGTRGSGYECRPLLEALEEYLGISEAYPVVVVGTRCVFEALKVIFPADSYGLRQVAYFSENPEDVGFEVNDHVIRHTAELPSLDPELGIQVALVAVSPKWVNLTLDLLSKVGIRGVLLLTSTLHMERPEGMEIIHLRMPCDIKSLACQTLNGWGSFGTSTLPRINDVQSR